MAALHRVRARPIAPVVWLLAVASVLVVLISNVSGIAVGDDGVGYGALADSLAAGDGYGYFLEHPATIWPPLWPGLMALVMKLTPLGAYGAAVVLNATVAFAVVIVGHLVIRNVVNDVRITLAGTAVLAVGPATVGLGHVLMTDMVFALLVLVWMLVLFRYRAVGRMSDLLAAAILAWVGFGLRYVGLVLIAFGGLWLLFDQRRTFTRRLGRGLFYVSVSAVVPALWMLRNHDIDGTFTGERNPSASGFVANLADLVATLGRFVLPGVANDALVPWALVGVVGVAAAAVATWLVLARTQDADGDGRSGAATVLRALWNRLGSPLGLLLIVAVGYLAYMLFVRTTTALNELDLRLLFQSYFPLLILALALCERLGALDRPPSDTWARTGLAAVVVWACANVVAGLVGTVGFAAGHPYFEGNYNDDTFHDVRASAALQNLPDDCVTIYSNLPNALYPVTGALWSPQQRAYESSRVIPHLEEVTETLGDGSSCLVWVDERPFYGHLWPLEELHERLALEELGRDGSVTTYRMHARDATP